MSSKSKLKSPDILLLLLYVKGKSGEINEPIDGMTRLTKMIFLFEKEIKSSFESIIDINYIQPEFVAYNFGPFSKELYDYVNFFTNIQYILQVDRADGKIDNAEIDENSFIIEDDLIGYSSEELEALKCDSINESSKIIKLTDRGISHVESKILDLLNDSQIKLLTDFKTKINMLTLDQILNYVYNKYEQYTTKSVIRDKYIKD